MKRIEIHNELTDQRYKNEDKDRRADKWLRRKIKADTFGKPERDIIYKKELISGGNVVVLMDSFDTNLNDRIISESTRFTDLMERPTEENAEDIQYKIYTRRVKSDYVVTETDITDEADEKDKKEKQKRIKKRNAEKRLAKILDSNKFDFSKPNHIKKALRRLLNYLEVEFEGDEDQAEE